MFFAPPEVKALSKYSEFGSHLGPRTFGITLLAAFVLHAGLIGIYSMMPHTKIIKIPVRVLNINLGADLAESAPRSEQPIAEQARSSLPEAPPKAVEIGPKSPQMELDKALGGSGRSESHSAFSKATRDKAAGDKKASAKDIPLPTTAKRYVREARGDAAKKDNESKANLSQKPEEIVQRYTQDISLWVSQRKIYPQEAKAQHVEGTAIVRLRVNRQGHVLYYVIDTSSGNPFLDRAAMSMVRASDPVPPVADNYPEDGDVFQFLVPITFKLEK